MVRQVSPEIGSTRVIQECAREFVETGKTVLVLPVAPLIPPIIMGVRQLIQDPDRDRWELDVRRPSEPEDEPDDGLVRKTNGYNGAMKDNKWFFHYRPSLPVHLSHRGIDMARHRSLLNSADSLHRECCRLALDFARAFDAVMPGYSLEERVTDVRANDLHVLRVLLYDQGSEIGKAHTDRDCFTFHVAENRPGLRTGAAREPYAAPPNRVLVFGGQKLGRLTHGRIPALEHDIVDASDDTTRGRWSIVFFNHIAGSGA